MIKNDQGKEQNVWFSNKSEEILNYSRLKFKVVQQKNNWSWSDFYVDISKKITS